MWIIIIIIITIIIVIVIIIIGIINCFSDIYHGTHLPNKFTN